MFTSLRGVQIRPKNQVDLWGGHEASFHNMSSPPWDHGSLFAIRCYIKNWTDEYLVVILLSIRFFIVLL
jgi:hypothetical protein